MDAGVLCLVGAEAEDSTHTRCHAWQAAVQDGSTHLCALRFWGEKQRNSVLLLCLDSLTALRSVECSAFLEPGQKCQLESHNEAGERDSLRANTQQGNE